MVDSTDAVVPILQGIQADLARLNAKLDGNTEYLMRQADKLETIENYVTFSMGQISQGRVGLDLLVNDVADLKRRLDILEQR